jgi:hypothetical protein
VWHHGGDSVPASCCVKPHAHRRSPPETVISIVRSSASVAHNCTVPRLPAGHWHRDTRHRCSGAGRRRRVAEVKVVGPVGRATLTWLPSTLPAKATSVHTNNNEIGGEQNPAPTQIGPTSRLMSGRGERSDDAHRDGEPGVNRAGFSGGW